MIRRNQEASTGSPGSPHLEGEAGMRSNEGEHGDVAEDVHRQVPRRSHSIGAAHVLYSGAGTDERRQQAAGRNGTGGEAM